MATKIVTKNSSTASAVPTASDLVQGELAVNVADKRLFTEDNAGAIVELGTNPSGNVTFQDNGKAIFGAGSDLQIYHDGSDSYIKDEGTGNLYLTTNGSTMNLQAGSDNMVKIYKDAQVEIFHDASVKLATTSTGIDVTGSVRAAGLEVGTSSDSYSAVYILSSITGESELRMGDTDTDAGSIAYTNSDDTMTFRAAAGARMTLDSTGIDVTGTATMDAATVQTTGSTTAVLTLNNADGNGTLSQIQFRLTRDNPDHGNIKYTGDMIFTAGAAERMRIDSSGRVGIGRTPSISNSKLEVGGADNVSLINVEASGVTGGMGIGSTGLQFFHGSSAKMHIDSSGNVGINQSNPTQKLHVSGNAIITGLTRIGDGTASSPSYQFFSDTDTGMYRASSNILGFSTGGAERMRIDSSGNLTTRQSTGNNFRIIRLGDNSVEVGNYNATDGYQNTSYLSSTHTFYAGTAGAGGVSRAVDIDASGNLLVGTTDENVFNNTSGGGINLRSSGEVQIAVDSGETIYLNRMGSDGRIVNFRKAGAFVAGIDVTSTTVTYNTSSDQRLKENIADADDAGSKVDAIQVRKFDWKADGSHQDYGMIAQELQAVAPEAVSGDADSEEMMGVDYSKLVPMLIKEIQSLRNRVAQLEE